MSVIRGLKNPKAPEWRGCWQWMYDEEAFKELQADQEFRDFINFFKYGRNMTVDTDGDEAATNMKGESY